MFEITDKLCERYHGLTAFTLRKEKSGEVLLLINRVIEARNCESVLGDEERRPGDQVIYDNNGNKIIRRKAVDDSWY